MIKTIIFDFNRTLYNPDVGRLVPQAKQVLAILRRRNIQLLLLSRKEPTRGATIESLGISQYFASIKICPKKTRKVIRELVAFSGAKPEEILVVGDRIQDEIALGNLEGIKTVRFLQGKFANEIPATETEIATYTIKSLPELLPLAR